MGVLGGNWWWVWAVAAKMVFLGGKNEVSADFRQIFEKTLISHMTVTESASPHTNCESFSPLGRQGYSKTSYLNRLGAGCRGMYDGVIHSERGAR
jgi:hypothetical protein